MDPKVAQETLGIYPVDILQDDSERLRETALAYYAMLQERAGSFPEVLSLPTGEQVKLEASSVCFCTMHRDEPQQKLLVLVNPQDTRTVVAVYLNGVWWPTEDVLRTSDPAREGLMKVQTFGERIALFILNVVIFGRLERNLDADGMFFLPHSVTEQAKILWRDGAAVGFYTTKIKGSLCSDGSGECYVLPVLDTVFIRRQHRRQGLALALLQDFCETFQEDEALGVSCPISPAMLQVCRKFLLAHPEERGRLWEVEPPGSWGHRLNVWLKIRLQQSQLPGTTGQLILLSHLGRTVCSGDSEDGRPCNPQDDGSTASGDGGSNKERIPGEKMENTEEDEDGRAKEAELVLGPSGMPAGASLVELAGEETRRTGGQWAGGGTG